MTADWPPREFGLTAACGDRHHERCPGQRTVRGEPWGPCTCSCHHLVGAGATDWGGLRTEAAPADYWHEVRADAVYARSTADGEVATALDRIVATADAALAALSHFDGYPATEFRGNIDLPSTPEDEL